MVAALIGLIVLQGSTNEPILGGYAEIVTGIRAHPQQSLGLYIRRSQIAAYFPTNVRQAANDPWIRVGETRTTVREERIEGLHCLVLESHATREILGNNPFEGQTDIKVKRKVSRFRKVWVAEDGSIVKTYFEQVEPESYSVDMILSGGIVAVTKKQASKTQTGQIEMTVDTLQFENEFLSMWSNGKALKAAKSFATLDPFSGGVRTLEAKIIGSFEGYVGKDRYKGCRVQIKDSKGVTTVWVSDEGELVQLDTSAGERLQLEPKVGDVGIQKVKLGGG